MNLKGLSLFVSSAIVAGGLALSPSVHSQGDSTVVVIGGAPDVVYVDPNGNMYDMSGMGTGSMNTMGTMNGGAMTGGTMTSGTMTPASTAGSTNMMQTPMGPVKVQGVIGDWVPALDVPVFSGVVVSHDIVGESAVVKSDYGYVAVPTGAGAQVLYRGGLVNWGIVPVGAVVQLPISYLVTGPIPHRVRVKPELMMNVMNPGMMGTGMTTGMTTGGAMMTPTTGGMGAMTTGAPAMTTTTGGGTMTVTPGTTGTPGEATTTTTTTTGTVTPDTGTTTPRRRRRRRNNPGGTTGTDNGTTTTTTTTGTPQ